MINHQYTCANRLALIKIDISFGGKQARETIVEDVERSTILITECWMRLFQKTKLENIDGQYMKLDVL